AVGHREETAPLAQEDPGLRARQRARSHQQGSARPLLHAGDRRQEPLLEHRGRTSRPRPPQGRPARDATGRLARRARTGQAWVEGGPGRRG
ncbi:MAG: Translation initiation factor 2, partial [uncultured Acidimicrobiales bacterium]